MDGFGCCYDSIIVLLMNFVAIVIVSVQYIHIIIIEEDIVFLIDN